MTDTTKTTATKAKGRTGERTANARRDDTGRNTGKGAHGGERADLYQEITDQIIAELEAGTVPWAQPWDSSVALDTAEATFALPPERGDGTDLQRD